MSIRAAILGIFLLTSCANRLIARAPHHASLPAEVFKPDQKLLDLEAEILTKCEWPKSETQRFDPDNCGPYIRWREISDGAQGRPSDHALMTAQTLLSDDRAFVRWLALDFTARVWREERRYVNATPSALKPLLDGWQKEEREAMREEYANAILSLPICRGDYRAECDQMASGALSVAQQRSPAVESALVQRLLVARNKGAVAQAREFLRRVPGPQAAAGVVAAIAGYSDEPPSTTISAAQCELLVEVFHRVAAYADVAMRITLGMLLSPECTTVRDRALNFLPRGLAARAAPSDEPGLSSAAAGHDGSSLEEFCAQSSTTAADAKRVADAIAHAENRNPAIMSGYAKAFATCSRAANSK